jgi:predicted HTH transcriptional regulator
MPLDLDSLLGSLVSLPRETEWIEFKHNDGRPEEIGEYISALSNAATLHDKEAAYLVWGVEDETHRIVGTSFRPRDEKIGNEELENWLTRSLHPQVDFTFNEWTTQGLSMVLLAIRPCLHGPVRFKDADFIRVGSYKKRLKDYPEKERALWFKLAQGCFEEGVARDAITADEVLSLLEITRRSSSCFKRRFRRIRPAFWNVWWWTG